MSNRNCLVCNDNENLTDDDYYDELMLAELVKIRQSRICLERFLHVEKMYKSMLMAKDIHPRWGEHAGPWDLIFSELWANVDGIIFFIGSSLDVLAQIVKNRKKFISLSYNNINFGNLVIEVKNNNPALSLGEIQKTIRYNEDWFGHKESYGLHLLRNFIVHHKPALSEHMPQEMDAGHDKYFIINIFESLSNPDKGMTISKNEGPPIKYGYFVSKDIINRKEVKRYSVHKEMGKFKYLGEYLEQLYLATTEYILNINEEYIKNGSISQSHLKEISYVMDLSSDYFKKNKFPLWGSTEVPSAKVRITQYGHVIKLDDQGRNE